jgi:hypothetical protein
MNFEEAFRAELSTITELTNKVYPLNATEGVKAPYVIYMPGEGLQDKTLEGYLASKEVECEINILHDSYGNLKSLAKQVLSKVISFQSRMIGDNGPFIQNVTYEKPVELYESQVFLYRCVIDLKFRL